LSGSITHGLGRKGKRRNALRGKKANADAHLKRQIMGREVVVPITAATAKVRFRN